MILVTGGTGFVGARVTLNLLARGASVAVLDSRPVPARLGDHRSHANLRIVEGDIADLDDVLAAIHAHGVVRVIHLAAVLRDPIDREPRLGMRVNIVGTTNVFEAARLLGVQRVVYASSTIVHGDQGHHGDAALTEDSPIFPPSLYAYTKIMNEVVGRRYLEGLGLDCRGLRVCSPIGYGRDGRGAGGAVGQMIAGAARGVPVRVPYAADEQLPYIHVDDVAEIFVRLCLTPRLSLPVYMSSATSVSFGEIREIVGQYVPGAEIAFAEAGEAVHRAQRIDGRRLAADIDYALPPVAARVRDHLNAVRAADGLPSLS
jgi:UDP-glucose 4-epimerase